MGKKELPNGIQGLIEEMNNRNLRNRQFRVNNAWKKNSIAYRLGNRARNEISEITKYKNTKDLSKKFTLTALTIKKQTQCNTRNCFICRHDPNPLPPSGAA